ncbi:hemolysin family protein [Mycoplasmopsis hyopharyngis]|uniref:hemolysin family protein n=1 Tax=Mycoplasmopsis hyopharyngis TaxID=29558 RepID=UPI003872E177
MKAYNYIIYIVIFAILIFFSAIFSGLETAYTSLTKAKIDSMLENKARCAKLISRQHKAFNQTLSTLLIVNNIVNIAASTFMSYFISKLFVDNNQFNVLISTGIMTPIIVLLGEIVPKLIAKSNPKLFAQSFAWLLEVLFYIFFIFTWPLKKIGKKIYITNSEDELKSILDIAQNEGVLETNESLMAQNALDLDSTRVKKHYVKIEDTYFIQANDNIKDTLEVFKETNYSRLPVQKDGNFIGIVHLKDIFYLEKGKVINYFKTIPFISANISLSTALEKMRSTKSQMAFVTENNNSQEVIGILTIEDIIEEIVGEIYDEYDEEEYKKIFEISLELFHIMGKTKMKEIIKQLELKFDLTKEENNLTLTNWLVSKIGHKIKKSTTFKYEDVSFSVIEMPTTKSNDYKFEIELGSKTEHQEKDTNEISE